jgi:hypothetical protein
MAPLRIADQSKSATVSSIFSGAERPEDAAVASSQGIDGGMSDAAIKTKSERNSII